MSGRYGNYYNFKALRSECEDRTRLAVIAFRENIPQQYNIIVLDIFVIFTQYVLYCYEPVIFFTRFLLFDFTGPCCGNRVISCNQTRNCNTEFQYFFFLFPSKCIQ
jgi:hypothetical protein